MSDTKKVSVVIPNYNYGKYIEKRIDSVVNQTYPIYELIVLDDASTDGSRETIERKLEGVRRRHPGLAIKFEVNKKNSGKAMTQWKKGVSLATGDYVWIAEVDDNCSKKFLAEVMRGFDDSQVVVSYTESMIMNGAGMIIAPNFRWSRDREKTGHFRKSYVREGVDEIKEIMAIRCVIPNVSAVVFKKNKKLIKELTEAEKFQQVGDWYLYVRLLTDGKLAYNRKALNRFRVHRDSVTGGNRKSLEHLAEIENMQKTIAEEFELTPEVKKRQAAELLRLKSRMDKI